MFLPRIAEDLCDMLCLDERGHCTSGAVDSNQ
jgi:hypothetical protein